MYQDNTLASSINAFSVEPSLEQSLEYSLEQSITVPAQVLQDLLGAVQELKDEVAALRSERDQDRQELAAMRQQIAASEKWQATLSDNQYTQLQIINSLREDVHKDPAPSATTKKSTAHIDELHRLMTEEKSQQVSIAKGARLLDISKERLRQLKPLILADGRFEMGWSTMKGQKGAVIRIRQYLKGTKFWFGTCESIKQYR